MKTTSLPKRTWHFLPWAMLLAVLLAPMAQAQESEQKPDDPPPTEPSDENESEKNDADENEADEDALPKYEDMEVPTVKELLLEPPVDWIRIKNTDEVIVVEPVYPRPHTLDKIAKQIEEMNDNRPRGAAALEAWRKKRADLNFLNVVLPDGGATPEFRIETEKIEEIIHHEELLLRRVDLLVDAGEYRKAFELLYKLERRLPDWPGLEDRKNYLLFMQAEGYRKDKDWESALAYYEQLHERKPDYPELKTRLGEVTDNLVQASASSEDDRKARHFLGRLRRLENDHSVVNKWEKELESRATEVLEQSRKASSAGEHDEAATLAKKAVAIWPDTSGLRADYLKAWKRFQRLHVGAMQLAGEPTEFFLPTAADERHEHLTWTRLFSVSQSQGTPRYHSNFIEQWEPKDLGRRAVFRLRPGRLSWEARPETTATHIVNTFNQRLDPNHEAYDERLASYVESISVTTPLDMEVKFSRVPLRTEALLNFPLRRTAFAAKQYEGPQELAEIHSEAFVPVEKTPKLRRYRRAIPEDDDSTEFHVAEIQEHKYDSHSEAVQALMRGEIDMIARARVWHVDPLIESNKFFVLRQNLPRVHVLQFNPQSKPLGNREFRRALVHSINKKRILHEDILRSADDRHARLVTAPYDRGNYAYNPLVEPRKYDMHLAVALRLASQKALGGRIPTLTMVCDPDPPIVAAAEKMIANWKRAGIDVRLLNGTGEAIAQDSDQWDIVYRTVVMPEPLTQLWPFLTMQSRARIADLDHLPDWLRQELIALDNANDWKSAIDQLRRLQDLLQAEVQLIPLWEVDEYAVYRRHLEGFRRDSIHPYQNIDRWTVGTWIPPKTP